MKNKKKMSKVSKITLIVLCAIAAAAVIFLGTELIIELSPNNQANEITIQEAQEILNKEISTLPLKRAYAAEYVFANTKVTVTDMEYGYEKNIILSCTYETIDVKGALNNEKINLLFMKAKAFCDENPSRATEMEIKLQCKNIIQEYFNEAKKISGEISIEIYELADGSRSMYFDSAIIDEFTGGLVSTVKKIEKVEEIKYSDDNVVNIKNDNNIRKGVSSNLSLNNYDKQRPETAGWLIASINEFVFQFNRCFIENGGWLMLIKGLGNTLLLTLLSLVFGTIIGILIAIVKVTNEKTGTLPILNKFVDIYLAVIRGTPAMVQMIIMYFIILSPFELAVLPSAVICFSINSGAYVAEIIRGGIMSVDGGQNEAGRSLGLSYSQTMVSIIIPQAFKAVLPSLANEFITLLKETSVAFYIGLKDLTAVGLDIKASTFNAYLPLIAVAVIYLVFVIILTKLVGLLEKKLKKSER